MKDAKNQELNVGDEVRVYKDTNCQDFKCVTTVKAMTELPSKLDGVLWLDRIIGCWDPKAVIKTGNRICQ